MILANDAAALAEAVRALTQLQKENGYNDPRITMVVQSERCEMVWSIPLLPGYA